MTLNELLQSATKTCLLLHALTTAYFTPEPLVKRFEDRLAHSESAAASLAGIVGWMTTEATLTIGPAVYGIANEHYWLLLPAAAKLATNAASFAYSKTDHYRQQRETYCEKHDLPLDWKRDNT